MSGAALWAKRRTGGDQPRDDHGRFASGGGGGGGGKTSLSSFAAKEAVKVADEVVDKAKGGGFSLRPFAEMREPKSGTMVSLPTSAGLNVTLDVKDVTPEKLRSELKPWLEKAIKHLATHPETYLGGWFDKDAGKLYFDVSERHTDLEHAKKLGRERNQVSIYNIESGKLHDTGGTGA